MCRLVTNYKQQVIVICILALNALAGCSSPDTIVYVDDDDAEMNAAIAEARATLPRFWEAFVFSGPSVLRRTQTLEARRWAGRPSCMCKPSPMAA